MFDPFSDEGAKEVGSHIVRCGCGRLVSLAHRSITDREKVGFVSKITGLRVCYAVECECGKMYRTKLVVYENKLGKLVLVVNDADNGDAAGQDGHGDTQEAAGGPGGA